MKQEIVTNQYLRIPEFISRDQAKELAKQFKEHALSSKLQGDDQVPNSLAAYDFLPFVRLLVEKIPEVSFFLGEPVLPCYTYARIYKNGSVLERHRDRPACEVSLTINLNKDQDWPISFQRADGSETSVELQPGDAVMYLGCQAEHWRNQFDGREYTQLFIHYVKSYGDRAWAYFDKNKNLHDQEVADVVQIKNTNWKPKII
jgi:hypothetical protein